ncbi:Heat-labile enterotoxin IIA, A chain [Colletotrichum sp. SAR11_239]|nr:Heat-labile enterotoxin IIA, A chain [Colletotrichum sp. SAR11_239]
MFGNQPLIYLFFLVTNLWSLICAGAPTSLVYVYRGDSRSPVEIQEAGGFLPKGQSAFGAIAPDISLFNHAKAALDGSSRDDYGYVFTSASLDIAERFINMRPEGYIYKIHVTANIIDSMGTLGKHNPLDDEREYAALGGIKFEQIVSWRAYENGKSGEEELNKEFNEKVYSATVTGGVQFQLAGFLENTRCCEEQPGKSGLLSKRRFGFGLGSLKSGFGALRSIKGVKSISNVFKSNPFKKGPKTSPFSSAPQSPVKSGPGRKMPDLDPTPAAPINQGLPADKSPMDNTPVVKAPVVDKTPDNVPGDKTPVDKTPSHAAPSIKPDVDGTPGQQPGAMRQGPDDQVSADGTNGRLGGVGGSGMPIAINPFPAAGFPMSPFPMTPFPSTTVKDTPVKETPAKGIPGKDTPVLDTPVSQLQARQGQICGSPKSAYEIAKAYLASVNM